MKGSNKAYINKLKSILFSTFKWNKDQNSMYRSIFAILFILLYAQVVFAQWNGKTSGHREIT